MWQPGSPMQRSPRAKAWACMGCQGKKHRGHPFPITPTVRGGRKARGQFPQIRAAGRTHTPRGERRFTCEFPQGGDKQSSNGVPQTSGASGVGGPFR